ncbi:MAG: hypothetical protein ACI87W_002530 [Halieaceae bacterium]|jgi:hypothetical protein
MNDEDFHKTQIALFRHFSERLDSLSTAADGAFLAALAEQFREQAETPATLLDEGPMLVARMLTVAPQLAEHFPRDLLWYLGGQCLHFMPDEEIELLGDLDEQRRAAAAEGRNFDWGAARARILQLQ